MTHTYRGAGVDLAGADSHVSAISDMVRSTWTDAVVGAFGGFSSGIAVPPGLTEPVVMVTTDGVGTKLELARQAGAWDGVGIDLVAMCVDDLAASGAAPAGFVDYMAVGSLDAERDAKVVASIANGCLAAGCALLGGETAEHPGVMAPDAVDLAGAAVGFVERDRRLGPHLVAEGDVVVGLASPNARSNGFSLVRALSPPAHLVEELLAPSVIYAPAVLAAVGRGGVNSAAHITGGGIPANLERALPAGLGAEVDPGSWTPPAIFQKISRIGVDEEEMYRVFNMGIGFCLIVDPSQAEQVIGATAEHSPAVIGSVVSGSGVRPW